MNLGASRQTRGREEAVTTDENPPSFQKHLLFSNSGLALHMFSPSSLCATESLFSCCTYRETKASQLVCKVSWASEDWLKPWMDGWIFA